VYIYIYIYIYIYNRTNEHLLKVNDQTTEFLEPYTWECSAYTEHKHKHSGTYLDGDVYFDLYSEVYDLGTVVRARLE